MQFLKQSLPAALICSWLLTGNGWAQQPRTLTITAPEQDRPASPAFVTLDKLDPTTGYALVPADGPAIPAQADADGRLWWWSSGMKKGQTMRYQLLAKARAPDVVQVEKAGEHCVNVQIGGELFTAFHFAEDVLRPYLYPLTATTGEGVTRNWPMKEAPGEKKDHPHHCSLWTAWGDVRPEGKGPGHNYWHNKKASRQKVARITRTVSGPVFGQIQAEVDWIAEDGTRDLTDTRTFTFFAGDKSQRVLDMRIVFHFPDRDITFADTKEAGILSLRMGHGMDEESGARMFNSAGGSGEKECWGKPAAWCDYVGKIGERVLGVAVLDHPDNFGHPARWHIRSYGLFTANPFAVRSFDKNAEDAAKSYKKGESATFNYRVIVHQATTAEAAIAGQWEAYAKPVKSQTE